LEGNKGEICNQLQLRIIKDKGKNVKIDYMSVNTEYQL